VHDRTDQAGALGRLLVELGQLSIVLGSPVGVAQDLVGAADLEEELGLAGFDVAVRVEAERGLAVCPPQLIEGGRARNPQQGIVVFGSCHAAPALRNP
jgi:hypothetical protein